MGTLTATLTLNDTDTFSDVLNFSISNEITTAAPAQMLKLVSVGTGAAEVLYADSGSDGTAFVYIKNANTSNSHSVDIRTNNGNNTYGTLDNGEFAFIPIDTNEGVEVIGVGGTVSVEFAFFTKA